MPDVLLFGGWVVKRAVSAVVFKNWRRRYLELEPGRLCWREGQGSAVLNELPLDSGTVLGEFNVYQRRIISVRTAGRELRFEPDCEEVARWYMYLVQALTPHRIPSTPSASRAFRIVYTRPHVHKASYG